jgi:deferrochelatase/peroxidase EfeB
MNSKSQSLPGRRELYSHLHSFGYEDGISQPSVDGVHTSLPGQTPIKPGVILLGRPGDIDRGANHDWVLDGSIMAFRVLEQHVPEL